MRLSRLFFKSLRAVGSEHETASHQLLLRAGYLHQLGQGLFSMLPLGQRAATKLEGLLRREMEAIGCQEVSMPIVQPADLWKRSGRYQHVGAELVRFVDRRERPMVLAMTHEEAATDLCRSVIASYRQLPVSVFQIQTKFRDDPRPRAGLIRVREFRMKDAYTFAMSEDDIDQEYDKFIRAYERIFDRCELPVLTVEADVGMMGGRVAHEFMYLTPVGEDTLVLCDSCGYSANRQVATSSHQPRGSEPRPIERVATPNTSTIEALMLLLGVEPAGTAKVVFFTASRDEGADEVVVAMVRGDMDVNETKLVNVVAAHALRPATEDEIRGTGAVPGYASPIGVTGCTVVVDELVAGHANLIAGANEHGHHLRNVNVGRDFVPGRVADIVAVGDGDPCPRCRHALRTSRGVEIANTFKLGTRYSDPLGANVQGATGQPEAVAMASYGIGVGRLLACIAEEHHDERGLLWPKTIAPYEVQLVAAGDDVREEADAYMKSSSLKESTFSMTIATKARE